MSFIKHLLYAHFWAATHCILTSTPRDRNDLHFTEKLKPVQPWSPPLTSGLGQGSLWGSQGPPCSPHTAYRLFLWPDAMSLQTLQVSRKHNYSLSLERYQFLCMFLPSYPEVDRIHFTDKDTRTETSSHFSEATQPGHTHGLQGLVPGSTACTAGWGPGVAPA